MSDAPPAAGRTAEQPIVLDVERTYIQGESARLRNCKPAARVERPDRVPAWAIGNYGLVRQLLADPRVSRNARPHWSAWKLGEIPKNWPLRLWAEIEHMGTACGGDHRRLRSLMSGAPTAAAQRHCGGRSQTSPPGCLMRSRPTPDGEVVDLKRTLPIRCR